MREASGPEVIRYSLSPQFCLHSGSWAGAPGAAGAAAKPPPMVLTTPRRDDMNKTYGEFRFQATMGLCFEKVTGLGARCVI
jgi:hypothetical protein